MSPPVVICLPTADRQRAFAFYRDGLGFEPVGEPADDGVPDPAAATSRPTSSSMAAFASR